MEIFRAIISAFRKMPTGVRYVTGFSMLYTLLLPAAILPIGKTFVNSSQVSFAEFWSSGGGFLFAGIGVYAVVLSYGLLRACRWARHLVVVSGWSVVVATIVGWRGLSADVLAAFLMFGFLPSWYFYFRPSVREYFGSTYKNRLP